MVGGTPSLIGIVVLDVPRLPAQTPPICDLSHPNVPPLTSHRRYERYPTIRAGKFYPRARRYYILRGKAG
jgi:hypothetical protein